MKPLEWKKGEPARQAPGMVLMTSDGIKLVGDVNRHGNAQKPSDAEFTVSAWAWAIKPYELSHLSDMHKK